MIGTAGEAALAAFAVTLLLTPLVRLAAVRFGWVARPVDDRWGRRAVARLGGVAMFAGFATALLGWMPWDRQVLSLLAGAALVFALGLADDLRRMPPYTKLIAQLLIGCLVVLSGIRFPFTRWVWLAIPVSIMWVVLVMNAFNLLDNMDGLAAGVGAIAAFFCAWHAGLTGQWPLMTMAAIIGGVCLGFLRFNLPPAKIFMGDSGSHLLGLSLAALAMLGSGAHSTRLVSILAIPTLVLAVPIFDTCFVTIQRLAHGQHPFVGGTDHVSHRLAVLGLSTRQTVAALYGVSACLGLLSVASAALSPLGAFALWGSASVILVLCGLYLARVNVYRLAPQPGDAAVPPAGPTTAIGTMLLHKRRLLEILIDFALVSLAYVSAHLLRFEGALTFEFQQRIGQSLPLILLIKLACFTGAGLYRGVWRYLGLSDVVTIFKAVTLGSVLAALALLYLWRFEGYSRAVLVIDWMLTFLAVGGSRVVERLLDEWISRATAQGVPVVIVGAGDVGAQVLRLLQGSRTGHRVLGFLDDDVRKHGSRIHGALVLGGRERLAELVGGARIREVLIAMSDPPGELLQHIQRCCEPQGVTWRVVTAGVMNAA